MSLLLRGADLVDGSGAPRSERARLYADPAWRERARPDAEKVRPNFPEKASIEETVRHHALRGRALGEVAI